MESRYTASGIPSIRIEPESSSSASLAASTLQPKDVCRDRGADLDQTLSEPSFNQATFGPNQSDAMQTCNHEQGSGPMRRKTKPPQVLELKSPGSATDEETTDFLRPPPPPGLRSADDHCNNKDAGSNSKWQKLRTTVKTVGAVKSTSARKSRKQTLERQDSFLKRFSTRHCGATNPVEEGVHRQDDHHSTHIRMMNKRHRSVIHPDENFMFYWLTVITIAVLYNVWTCIARQAFRDIIIGYEMVWFITDALCDFIYLIDILVQLRTGYLERGLIVYDSKKLAKHYIYSRFFVIDLLSVLPLDLIQFYIGIHPVIRFPRFLKIYRTYRFVYIVETRASYPNLWRVLNLSHILFLGSHWFAAFYFMISKAEGFEGTWGYPKPVGEFASVTRKYLKSLYWSTLTLTTIGDLPPPESNWEWLRELPQYWYVFTIVSYLIGVFVFATIVGQVGNVITNRNASRQEFERLLDGAKSYMRNHNVPQDMQRRVQRWYDYAWSRGRMNGGGDINSLGLLPDKLKTELALHVNLETLKKVTIFQECEPEFLHDLVLKMRAFIFTPGDLICRKGEVAREMFIIADGLLEVISDSGEVLTQMSAGDFFGEIGILNLDGGVNRRTADVRSVGYAELFVLSRDDVLTALKDHPEAEALITDYGRMRLQELGAYRNKREAANETRQKDRNKQTSGTSPTSAVVSVGSNNDKVNCVNGTQSNTQQQQQQQQSNTHKSLISYNHSLLGQIIQFGRSEAAKEEEEEDKKMTSDQGKSHHQDQVNVSLVDAQSPDVVLIPMDTEESDVDLSSPLSDNQVDVKLLSSTAVSSSTSTSGHSVECGARPDPECDLMCLDSDGAGSSDHCTWKLLPADTSSQPARGSMTSRSQRPWTESRWLKSFSLDCESEGREASKLRKVKSDGLQTKVTRSPPRGRIWDRPTMASSDTAVEVLALKQSASYERRLTVQPAVILQSAAGLAGIVSCMEPPSVVFIVGDTDSTDLDRISNETLEVMLSEKDMTVSPSVVEGHSATGYKKNGSRRGSTPSMTSSNSSIFPACSPTGSVSGIHDFGAADERCAFVQPLYDDRNSVSGRRSLPIGDDVTGRERVFGSESMVNVAAAGSGAETAGSSWHVTADDPGHSSPADRHRDGEEADDENEEDDLLDAVRNVFEQKMAHYGQKYENRIKKLEAANREKELTIQQLQATINSLMASLRGGPGSGVELSNRPTCSPSPSPGT